MAPAQNPVAEVLASFRVVSPSAVDQQLTRFLRRLILDGSLLGGCRLPSTAELARMWQTPIATVQAALTPLVHAGLLQRKQRLGTVVRLRPRGITRIGIYCLNDSTRNGQVRFTHSLIQALHQHLLSAGISPVFFFDPRVDENRIEPFADLLHAARTHQVDAVIAPETDLRTTPWLSTLPVPTVILGSGNDPREMWFDLAQFGRTGAACLVANGCRSLGLISVIARTQQSHQVMTGTFAAIAAEAGITLRPQWIIAPDQALPEYHAERFGYEAIRRLIQEPERPDGLLVFTDRTSRGVLLGLLPFLHTGEAGPRLVLHRNRGMPFHCPLPAHFLELDPTAVAAALLAAVQQSYMGENPGRFLPHFTISEPEPAAEPLL